MKVWLSEAFNTFQGLFTGNPGSNQKVARIDAWALELMNSQPPEIKAIAGTILNKARLERLMVLETNATYPTILTLRFLVFGLIQNIHSQLPTEALQKDFELSLQDLVACYHVQNESQKFANAMYEEMHNAVKQIILAKEINHLNVLEMLDFYIVLDLKKEKNNLTFAEKRIAFAKSLLAEKEEYLRTSNGKNLSSVESPHWQQYIQYCREIYEDTDLISIRQKIAKYDEEYQKQLRSFEAKQQLSEKIISEIAIAEQTPSHPANVAAIMEFTEEILQECVQQLLAGLPYLEKGSLHESLQLSQIITMPRSDSLCIPAILAYVAKLETFFSMSDKTVFHSPAFYRVLRLCNKYKLLVREELNFDLNAISVWSEMAQMVDVLDKPFTSQVLTKKCLPMTVIKFYREMIPHLHNPELFNDIWFKQAPESYRNFKFDLEDYKILRFNSFSTPLLNSKIDFSQRPHDLDMFLTSDTLITTKKNTLAIVIQETRGHTAALFLERQADGRWNAVYLDSSADPVQMRGNLHHLVQCPNIGSIITYTRYLRRTDVSFDFVERALQASKTECGSAAVNFLSTIAKQSQNGKAIYQELIEFAQRAINNIDKYPEHFEYQSAKKNLPNSPKLFIFPILAAPASLIKISQSDAILEDFTLIHEGDTAAFVLHNRRKESLQSYRERNKSTGYLDSIMERKKQTYADRFARCSLLGSAAFWQVTSAKPQYSVPETDNRALKNLAMRLKDFIEKYMVMETLKLSVINDSTELCISGYVRPRGFEDVLGILTLSINPCNLASNNLGSMRFSMGSEGFSRARGEDIKFDLVISKYDSQYGLLLDGMAYGYKFQPSKSIFKAELIDQGFKHSTNTEMSFQSFTNNTESDLEMKISYNGYNTDYQYWGEEGVEMTNFPLKTLLRLGFGIQFPDIFDANDNPNLLMQ